jgi:hypothetical protein
MIFRRAAEKLMTHPASLRDYRPRVSLWQIWQCCATLIVAVLGTASELALWHSEQQ